MSTMDAQTVATALDEALDAAEEAASAAFLQAEATRRQVDLARGLTGRVVALQRLLHTYQGKYEQSERVCKLHALNRETALERQR